MSPACIADDEDAAKAVHRKALRRYGQLPNHRDRRKSVGYAEGMAGIEKALQEVFDAFGT